MDLIPSAEKPDPFELLACELIAKEDYVGVGKDEISFFLPSGWNLVFTKGGKWRIE